MVYIKVMLSALIAYDHLLNGTAGSISGFRELLLNGTGGSISGFRELLLNGTGGSISGYRDHSMNGVVGTRRIQRSFIN